MKSIEQLEEKYELELESIVIKARKIKAKTMLLQFPDGMKPFASAVSAKLQAMLPKTNIIIWMGSCYGACDTPRIEKKDKIDLVVQFGHTKWKYQKYDT